jgi:hypothetical protein
MRKALNIGTLVMVLSFRSVWAQGPGDISLIAWR